MGVIMNEVKKYFFFFAFFVAFVVNLNVAHSSGDPVYYLGGDLLVSVVLDRDEGAD